MSGWKDRIGRSDPALLGAAAGGFVLGALVMGLLARRKPIPAVALLALLVALAATAAQAHEGDDHAAASRATAGARDLAQRLADGSLLVPKPTQRLLAVRTDIAASGVHQLLVAGVQRSHRRHESDALPREVCAADAIPQLRDRRDHVERHVRKSV